LRTEIFTFMKSSKPGLNFLIADSLQLNILPCMADSQKSWHCFTHTNQIKEPLNSPSIPNALKKLSVEQGLSWTQQSLCPLNKLLYLRFIIDFHNWRFRHFFLS
jgi:hypothetical protein